MKIDPQNMKENIIYGSAIVNYPRDTYYRYKSDISVINNEVLIDTRVSTNKGSFFYHSQFMLSDLDNSNMHNSIDVEPTSCSEITARWY